MQEEFLLYELLGPSCFAILARYLDEGKAPRYPFKMLAPFIRSARDLAALTILLKHANALEACMPAFRELIARIAHEKSNIIPYEFEESSGGEADMEDSVSNFMKLRNCSIPKADTERFLHMFLENAHTNEPRSVQTGTLRCCMYTTHPEIQGAVSNVYHSCRDSDEGYDEDRRDFFVRLYETRYSSPNGSDDLLIATTLPLITYRPTGARLEALHRNAGHIPLVRETLREMALAYLRNAGPDEYHKLIEKLTHYGSSTRTQ